MNLDLLLKNTQQETRIFYNRIIVAVTVVIFLSLLVLIRLFYLQVIQHSHFTTLAEDNRLRVLPLPPSRGLIYDRNGVILAENHPSFSLDIVPEQARGGIDALIAELSLLVPIDAHDVNRFKRQLRQFRRFDKVTLRYRLNDEELARIALERHRLPGVYISASLSRHYPMGERGVHAIGYVGRINEQEMTRIDKASYRGSTHIGKTGVERSYEEALHGKVGYQQVEADVQGRVVRVLHREAPIAGGNLHLNLDMRLQVFTEDLLVGQRASVVALDPRNGEILALVSTPMFDPNPFVNGIDVKSYNLLQHSPDRPLYNRALQGTYPPGSTIKAFVGLAGLHHGVISLNTYVGCPGFYRLPGEDHRYRDWKRTGHGMMNLHHAIEQSCDVYFYELANRLGIDNLSLFMQKFSFGQKTGIDINGEFSGLMPTRAWKRQVRKLPWYPGETLISGIGQGFSLSTPLQLAVATGILSQQGKFYRPRIGFAVDDSNSQRRELINNDLAAEISLPQEHWDAVIGGMYAVMHGARGTARTHSLGMKYEMAGKTGTAQVVGMSQEDSKTPANIPQHHQDHALFVAFAPLNNPRIAIAVLIENGGSGSKTAAPIARQVVDYYLNDLSG
jgi:penicillin-binding protein 2